MDKRFLFFLCSSVFIFMFFYATNTRNDSIELSSLYLQQPPVNDATEKECPPPSKCPPVPQCLTIPCPPCEVSTAPGSNQNNKEDDDNPPCRDIALSRKYDTRCTVLSPENIRQFVVTGTGRSGTTAMFGALKNIGLSCGHERVGRSRDGGVGWPYAVYGLDPIIDKDRLGLSRDLRFRVVLHQVRYPLKSIASLQTIKQRTFQFIEFHTGVKFNQLPMRRAMEHWITWNALVDKVEDVRYRLEDTHPVDVCVMAGFSMERCLRYPPTTEFNLPNARDHSDYTWEDLEQADPELAKIAKKMTLDYGYTLNRTEADIEKDRQKLLARQEELMQLFLKMNPAWTPAIEEERQRQRKEIEAKNSEIKRMLKEAQRAANGAKGSEGDDEGDDEDDDEDIPGEDEEILESQEN